MKDATGLSDACYHEVSLSERALSIGFVALFPLGTELELDADMLRRNATLVRNKTNNIRVMHPAELFDHGGNQHIIFEPWVDRDKAERCFVVLRRKAGQGVPEVLCARSDEKKCFEFDRKVNGPFRYIDLVYPSRDGGFNPVFFRFKLPNERPWYLRLDFRFDEIGDEIKEGEFTPVATLTEVMDFKNLPSSLRRFER